MTSCSWIVASVALAALGGAGTAAGPQQDRAEAALREGLARNVYVSVADNNGAPVQDLTPEEVAVKVDGKSRQVLRVAPASQPMQIALLVDDSGPGIQYIRTGVGQFIRLLQNQAEIAIISTAGRNTVVCDFTQDSGALMMGVNRLSTRTTTGGYLLDAIQESARTLQRREAVRPVIVVIALEGTEFSTVAAAKVLDAVAQSGALVHVLSVGKPTMKTMTSWNQRPTDSIHEALDETMTRATVLVEAPRRSGGRLEQITQATGIPTRFAEIASELRNQLAVTYARPEGPRTVEKIEVSVKRRGLKLRAPKQIS